MSKGEYSSTDKYTNWSRKPVPRKIVEYLNMKNFCNAPNFYMQAGEKKLLGQTGNKFGFLPLSQGHH
jgi:hypothetical protein